MVISQKLGRIYSQNSNFLKGHSIFFKAALFSPRSAHVGTQKSPPPTTSGAAASGSKDWKGQWWVSGKFEFAVTCLILLVMSLNFQQTAIFAFG